MSGSFTHSSNGNGEHKDMHRGVLSSPKSNIYPSFAHYLRTHYYYSTQLKPPSPTPHLLSSYRTQQKSFQTKSVGMLIKSKHRKPSPSSSAVPPPHHHRPVSNTEANKKLQDREREREVSAANRHMIESCLYIPRPPKEEQRGRKPQKVRKIPDQTQGKHPGRSRAKQ